MKISAISRDHFPTGRSIARVFLIAAVILWAAWVSIRLTQPSEQKIVQVRMSEIMRDFVDANAKGDADPEITKEAITRYLKATDAAVTDLSRSGHVILVAEAVLSKNTPDATMLLKNRIADKLEAGRAETPQ